MPGFFARKSMRGKNNVKKQKDVADVEIEVEEAPVVYEYVPPSAKRIQSIEDIVSRMDNLPSLNAEKNKLYLEKQSSF
eukprot:Pgem_evm1s19582